MKTAWVGAVYNLMLFMLASHVITFQTLVYIYIHLILINLKYLVGFSDLSPVFI